MVQQVRGGQQVFSLNKKGGYLGGSKKMRETRKGFKLLGQYLSKGGASRQPGANRYYGYADDYLWSAK